MQSEDYEKRHSLHLLIGRPLVHIVYKTLWYLCYDQNTTACVIGDRCFVLYWFVFVKKMMPIDCGY